MRKIVLLVVLLCAAVQTWGYDFSTDGIFYNIVSEDNLTCEVTGRYTDSSNVNAYSGNVVIPETTTYLGKTYSVVRIGSYAFYYCENLTGITIPSSITYIAPYAFNRCTGLVGITIPNSITYIGSYAFCNCTGLTEIVIPNSVTRIRGSAFDGCKNLTKVTLPNSLTSIEDDVFVGCYSLTGIEIPNSVTSIGKEAFFVCQSLEEVTIGNSVENIGSGAFGYCESLSSVTSLRAVPPTCERDTFSGVPTGTCTLYVPLGATKDYSEATGWKDFFFIEEIDTSGIEALTPDGADVVGYYTLDGKKLSAPQKGVNVVRYSNGSVRKVVVE